jgi:microcystin-dependent protein
MHEGTGPGLTPRPLGQKGGSETGQCTGASEFGIMQPYTTLNYIIALEGLFPPRDAPLGGEGAGVASADPYLGEIILFAGNFAPRGWAFCDGQLLLISQYSALFAILGTTYGGDGRTTFALPDLRGRVPMHAGSGPGPGLTPRPLGQKMGSETGQCDCDTVPPIVTIDSPTSAGYTTDTLTVTLSGDAAHYWYYIAGVDVTNQTWTTNQSRTLSDGMYTLHAYGNDSAGNIAHVSVSFTIDTSAPSVSIDSPTDISYATDTILVALTGNADNYWYYIDGFDKTNQSWTSDTNRILTDGSYTLHAFGNDSSGNIQHVFVSFIVDTVDPIVIISQPTNSIFTEDSVTLTYHISEPGSVSIFIDNVLSTSTNNNSVISGLINGVHNITIVITDNAGNSGSTTMIFEIDVQITTTTTTRTTTTTSITSPEFPTNGWSILVLLLSIFSLLIWRKFRIQR